MIISVMNIELLARRRIRLGFTDFSRSSRCIVACAPERNGGGGETQDLSSFLSWSQTYALLKQQMDVAAKSELKLNVQWSLLPNQDYCRRSTDIRFIRISLEVPVIPLQRVDGPTALDHMWHNKSHLTSDQPPEQGVPIMITWSYGGIDVAVEGFWDGCKSRREMQRSGKDHFIMFQSFPLKLMMGLVSIMFLMSMRMTDLWATFYQMLSGFTHYSQTQ